MRRITTGRVGDPVLGRLLVQDNLITTIGTNADLSINPNGTGQTNITGDLQVVSGGRLRLGDSDNTNFVSFQSPATVASDLTLVLPNTYGSNGQLLSTDGAGNLSWQTAVVAVTNDTTTNGTFYPTFTSSSSGDISDLTVTNTKLTFNPSTGVLTSPVVTGGTGASNNLVLRSTTSGTKGQVYIDETTASSSTSTGALRVGGGVGIGGACYVGGAFTAASITETSSITLKENINPIESALDKIMQLVGVTYDRKNGSAHNEAGLIAEEVNSVLPNLVAKDQSGNPESIQYTKLTAYLIEAVKTLKKEIDELKGAK